jgi:uncharacterized protein YecT (DUF1311 family)
MRNQPQIVGLAALLAIAGPAKGQTDAEVASRITPTLHECENAPENGRTVCEGAEARRQDQQLNKTWARVMTGLPPRRQRVLRDIERTWIRQREKDCQSEMDDYVNSTARYMFAHCMAEASIRRTFWLEHLARTPRKAR